MWASYTDDQNKAIFVIVCDGDQKYIFPFDFQLVAKMNTIPGQNQVNTYFLLNIGRRSWEQLSGSF